MKWHPVNIAYVLAALAIIAGLIGIYLMAVH
ncbi:cell envelope integrity protein CreD [Mesorhizobium sp. Root552]|jgi:hypothetical protein|nr:cell envelope integrity protein CreD [Mesorhizobium sp. Root552]